MNPTVKLSNLQVLRFVAAALVVLVHAVDLTGAMPGRSFLALGNFENFGAVGVDIFFVISGFIITRSTFQGRPQGWKTFLWNRFSRVAPIYYLMSLPWLAILALSGKVSLGMLISTFLFWPAVSHSLRIPALPVGWTLWFEMLFYLSVTFVLLVRTRLGVGILLVTYFMAWGLRSSTNLPVFQFLGNPIILEFLFGVAIAILAGRIGSRAAIVLGLAAVGWFAATVYFGFGEISEFDRIITGELSALRVAVWGLPSAMLVWAAVRMERGSEPGHVAKAFVYLGDASYSIYLVHKLVFLLIGWSIPLASLSTSRDLVIIASCVLAIAIGAVCYQVIEKPLLALLKGKRVRPAAVVSGG